MRNQRSRAALKMGRSGESNPKKFITEITDLPYEILIMILSLLPVKDAVVASSVCKKSRYLWCDLSQLNFDASESLYKISKNKLLYYSEKSKYIKQVNSVIQEYDDHPMVHKFRINFDLGYLNQMCIGKWLEFVVNKKVEILELDIENAEKVRDLATNFEFPFLSARYNWFSIAFVSLKKLYLNNVRVRDAAFEELLTRCPHLESISIHGSAVADPLLWQGGHVPTVHSGAQALSITLHLPKKTVKFDSIPELPNVKKLTLIIGAYEDDCLLEFASIAEACPNLETFIIRLLWFSPIRRRRTTRHVASDDHLGNLKLFKILGYYGRISDLEVATYVFEHAAVLKKVVIDPHCHNPDVISTEKDLLKKERTARSFALRQLKTMVPMKPSGVKLVIL